MANLEEQQVKQALSTGIEAYTQANKELNTLKDLLRHKELTCYTSGADSCIDKYDHFRVRYAMMTREHERSLENCIETCKPLQPKTMAGQELSKLRVTNAEEMAGFRDFVRCHTGCLEKGKGNIELMKGDVRTTLQQVALP